MNEYKRFFNHIPGNLEQSTYRVFEPNSKAEILNWFSRDDISNVQKDEFIKGLIKFDDNCGDFYQYRTYFLAAEALSYFPSCYSDVIVNQLLNWSYVYFGWQIIPKPLRRAAREALKVTDKQRVIAAFTNLLHTTTSRVTLRQAAVELGKLDVGNKTAIAALILLLDVSKDEHTQQRIIDSLASIGHGNENVVQALISFLTKTSNVSLCWNTITALGAIASSNQQAIRVLVDRLNNNACHNDNDYFKTAITLWELNPHNLVAQKAIVKILHTTNDYNLISVIMHNLLEINFNFQPVIKILSHKLASELEDVRLICAFYLAKLDVGNQAARQTLIEIITETESSHLDNKAFRYLLQFYPNHEDTVAVLTATQKLHENRGFFYAVAKNLDASASAHKTCIDTLIFSIQESLSKDDCYNAINFLRYLDFKGDVLGRDRIINALITFLQKNRGDNICLSAANALLNIDPGNETAVNILFEVLEFNRCEWACERTKNILLQAGHYHHQVVDKLIDLASSHKFFHSDNMSQAFRYLESIKNNQNYKHVIDTMMKSYLELFQDSLAPEYEEENSISPCQYFSYNSQLIELSDKLTCVLQPQHLPQFVKSLKSHLNKSTYNNASYRYEAIYNLIYYCAQNMSYVNFCYAWQH